MQWRFSRRVCQDYKHAAQLSSWLPLSARNRASLSEIITVLLSSPDWLPLSARKTASLSNLFKSYLNFTSVLPSSHKTPIKTIICMPNPAGCSLEELGTHYQHCAPHCFDRQLIFYGHAVCQCCKHTLVRVMKVRSILHCCSSRVCFIVCMCCVGLVCIQVLFE